MLLSPTKSSAEITDTYGDSMTIFYNQLIGGFHPTEKQYTRHCRLSSHFYGLKPPTTEEWYLKVPKRRNHPQLWGYLWISHT